MKKLTSFTMCATAPEIDYPRPDRLVTGNPMRTTWNHYETNVVSSGLWDCEPGAWNIAFADGKDEFFHVIPGGFTGLLEVLEHVRKHCVIIDHAAIHA